MENKIKEVFFVNGKKFIRIEMNGEVFTVEAEPVYAPEGPRHFGRPLRPAWGMGEISEKYFNDER